MSALRLGRLPDGTRDIRIVDDGAVGRISFARYGIRNGGPPVIGSMAVGESRYSGKREKRLGAHSVKVRPARATCDKWMRQSQETCGRTPGHGTECRSALALYNAAGRHRTGKPIGRPANV